ncbi:MAG: hypothetical protein GTN81_08775 [Proteobacteria bacterium]|nr:hypothetical protein [Pseudomonadota bacterium]
MKRSIGSWSAVVKDQQKADRKSTEALVQAVSVALGQCIVQIVHQVKQTTASHHLIQ